MQKLRGQSIIFMVDLRKENEPLRHSVGNRVQILPQNSPMVQFGKTLTQSKQPFALTRNRDSLGYKNVRTQENDAGLSSFCLREQTQRILAVVSVLLIY